MTAHWFAARKLPLQAPLTGGGVPALALRHARLRSREREMAVLAERDRIARDLHDAVSQTLFAANVLAGTLLRSATDESTREQARMLEKLNLGALAEMRLLMLELHPEAFEHVRIGELLRHAIHAFSCRSTIAAEADIASTDPLNADARFHLYRIAQEALSNVARHSQASRVLVRWQVATGRGASLRIVDDGIGFDPTQAAAGHFGLHNMQSRCAEIGARWQLQTAPGAGTTIEIEQRLEASE